MTNAERQARWRERQKEKLDKLVKLERLVLDADEARKLKARIRQLEAELARERKRAAAKTQRG